MLFEGRNLVAFLAAWILSLLIVAVHVGMLFQLWLLNQGVLGLSFWSEICTIVFVFISLVLYLRQVAQLQTVNAQPGLD